MFVTKPVHSVALCSKLPFQRAGPSWLPRHCPVARLVAQDRLYHIFGCLLPNFPFAIGSGMGWLIEH